MTEDRRPKASDESTSASTAARQRKKRKWDQPAESLISAGVAAPGVSLGMGGGVGISLPGAVPLSGVPATFATVSQLIQSSSLPQSTAAIVQKLNQPKIQDELIAREIVINDAEPAIRYKLTKRQTQEEIQKCTGAVVITRGKYRPPNGFPDSEKPLYLHISAGSHLKDTVERIKAVDHAASMVEEILKQGPNSQAASTSFLSTLSNGQVTQPQSTCVYLGFDADPSLNIAARIRGPNDQYINHIMNETGATVVLRGRGSGNLDGSHAEAGQQPLHLYLSSTNPKSLEDGRMLAENLLDTISAECGASRISSCKVYSAVPPPQQLMAGVQNSKVSDADGNPVAGLPCTAAGSTAATQSFPPTGVSVSTGSNVCPPGAALQSGSLLAGQQPLHLYLSSTNPKSLEDGRMLAENLLDTISAECGASRNHHKKFLWRRISSCKVYSAVPPPQQLMAGVQNSKVSDADGNPVAGLPCTAAGSTAATQSFPPTGVSVSTGSNVCPPGAALQSGSLLGYGSPPNMVSYTPPSVTGGTCYSGYEGIYPQATPLQQVALALRQAPASTASVISSSASLISTTPKTNSSSNADADKRPPQKRKFQELPVTSKEPVVLHQVFSLTFSEADRLVLDLSVYWTCMFHRVFKSGVATRPGCLLNSQQGSEFLKPGLEDSGLGSVTSMPLSKLVEPRSNGLPPPPPRNMPPPPPKFSLPQSAAKIEGGAVDLKKSSAPPPPPRNIPPPPPKLSSQSPPKVEYILLKLAEYGDEDDDVDGTIESPKDNPTRKSTSKPFWAV
ncbi:hypothetical protein COCNU_scaffold017435G000030 [Cocos nucifera]|nr:hypothetical protein [Cocos nucifera]